MCTCGPSLNFAPLLVLSTPKPTVTQPHYYVCNSSYSPLCPHPFDVSARSTPDYTHTVARQANSAQLFKYTMDQNSPLDWWKVQWKEQQTVTDSIMCISTVSKFMLGIKYIEGN